MLAILVIGCAAVTAACVKTSPFETDDPEHTDLNGENLRRLLGGEPQYAVKLVAIGDTHDEYDRTAEVARLINARNDIHLVVHAGDLTDRGLLQEFQWSQDALDEFTMPVLVTVGNHDGLSNGASIYRKRYGPFDYSFVWAGLTWIFFNSNVGEFSGEVPALGWLARAVENSRGTGGVVLVTHQPPFAAAGVTGNLESFYDRLLRDYDVMLFVHGHLEDFRLHERHGVPILQTSTFERRFFYTVITVDGGAPRFERCRFEQCEAVEPAIEGGGWP
jgi:3',5'-cyclic-AMP phosphodiesterase